MARASETDLTTALDEAAAGGRAVIKHRGRRLVILRAAELRRIEDQVEQYALAAAAMRAIREDEVAGNTPVTWEEVKARHRL